ncbi:spondin-1 [Calliphora vicina]|uniref:spondin-1 n=1 Tax=Calliphora vicina TaxID=7373 RepID=UPI00325A6FCD
MKKPPAKMFFQLMLTHILLLLPLILAAPSPPTLGGDTASFYSSSGFISSPSIYSYTIENQIPSNQTTTIYQAHPSLQQQRQQGATNRNLYYTSSNSNLNSNVLSSNRRVSGSSSTTSSSTTTTYSSPSSASLPAMEATQPAPISDCTLDRLAVYKVVLHTYWTRDLFPKHYPDWRPTAQWTKTLGRTHDSTFALYHIGQQATSGVKQFAETGKSDILDTLQGEKQQQQQQTSKQQLNTARSNASNKNNNSNNKNLGERSVFDEFNLPAIMTGAGRTEAKFFVDSNHSLVSLMTRIVPSPDWFIGVDSFQLCVGGSWIDTVTVEMDPLDAGSDNGFTFTAPNWPTSPQGVIYRITSRYPAHPAGSFFYPKSKRLPPIATFQFIKLKEYELSEVFNFAEDDRKYETVQTQTHLEMEHNHVEMNNELSANIERERQNEITPPPTTVTEKDRIRSKLLEKMNPMVNSSSATAGDIPKNDKQAIMQNIANSYRRSELSVSASASSSTSSLHATTNRRRRTKRVRDCRVSHWSEWSDCSKSCGIGEMHRYRKVIKHGKRGGRPCPPLKESKWCGSEKGCHKPETYFNWSNT